ncbi:MAG: DNA polymerase III subunit gamma/tau C-terminal domain-containing protein, partial [Glaciecola sp.]
YDFSVGQVFAPFVGELSAFLPEQTESARAEKLERSAQVDSYSAFVDATGLQAFTRQLLINARCDELTSPLVLKIEQQHQHLAEEAVLKTASDAISQLVGSSIEVVVEVGEVINTPYQIQCAINDMRLKYAKHIVQHDETIQELVKAFDANIIDDSIEAR